jgi:hypothetical protein
MPLTDFCRIAEIGRTAFGSWPCARIERYIGNLQGKVADAVERPHIDAADLVNCGLYRVDSIDMKFSEQDSPYFVAKHYRGPT